jgi:hypothetical protein
VDNTLPGRRGKAVVGFGTCGVGQVQSFCYFEEGGKVASRVLPGQIWGRPPTNEAGSLS